MWISIKPEDLQLKTSQLECYHWLSTLQKYPSTKKKMPRKSDRVVGADLFNILNQWEPTLKEESTDHALTAWLEQKLLPPELTSLRKRTMGSAGASTMGAVKLMQELLRAKDSNFKAIVELAAKQEALKGIKEVSPEGYEKLKEQFDKVNQALADQIKEQGQGKGDTTAIQAEDKQLNQAIKNVHADLDGVEELAKIQTEDTGTSDPSGNFSLTGNEDRMLELGLDEDLMSTIKGQTEFRQIMQSVGRLRIMSGEIKSRKPKPSPSPVRIATGSNLSDVVPSELAYLGDPDLEDLFLHKYLEGNLMVYDKKQIIKEGKGPIVVMVDFSGSMTGAPMRNAKAMVITMMRQALEEGRRCAFIPFATHAGKPVYMNTIEDVMELVHATNTSYGGLGWGTDFNQPLRVACDVVETNMLKADILMLTDGFSRVTQDILDRVEDTKDDIGARLVGVLFNGYWAEDMKSILDASVEVQGNGQIKLDWAKDVLEVLV